MSVIPGFSTGVSTDSDIVVDSGSKKFTELHILPQSEWRVEIPFQTVLKLNVVSGIAEIYGTELPNNVEMTFSGAKISIYAPQTESNAGCTIKYTTGIKKSNQNGMSNSSNGTDNEITEYVSEEESSMVQNINLHFVLESIRQQTNEGPRVMVIGNSQSGKTSLLKTLAAYALKMDRSPILVNLNPQEGVYSLPGSLTATPISDMFEVESTNGWGNTTTSGVTFHNPKQPIVKNYGFEKFSENVDLYKYQVSKLGVAVMSRLEEDSEVRRSGVLVDTPALTIKDFTIIENIVSDFEINMIVVIGNERLVIELRKKFKHKVNNSLNIVKLTKSGGVVEVDEAFVRNLQQQTIREYFYGTLKSPLSPYNTNIDFKDLVIYKTVESLEFNPSLAFLPSGDDFTPEVDDLDMMDEGNGSKKNNEFSLDKYYLKVDEPDASLLSNTILAITQLPANDKLAKNLMNTSVMGYAYVSDVDDAKKKMRILLPVPGTLPRNILIVTGIRYIE